MKINNSKFQVPENYTKVDFNSVYPVQETKTENLSEAIRFKIEALVESSSALEGAMWELVFAKSKLTDKQLESFGLLIRQAQKSGRLKDLIQKLEEGKDFSGLKYQNYQSVSHRLNFLGTDEEGAFENSSEIQNLRSAMEVVKKAAVSVEVTESPATRQLMRQLVDIESFLELKYGNPAQGIINAERARVIEGYLGDKFAKLFRLLELMKESETMTKAA
ncbi:hypothetical protein GW756_03485 [bacterium]|nr:hypothetical protein [bacterium]NCQ55419.1 hypothetical protein [Candidatus Parcubacteria bacterium]NCS67781.1 hypothetical protein [Candidatus Peregrinibacteria bacterium]NCS96405.1 hypothetical protein [bacterium]